MIKKKVVLVPIDDRPCHNEMIKYAMERMDNYNLVFPKKSDLGHFTVSGSSMNIKKFVEHESKDADILIISIDALAFGGLVQARSAKSIEDISYYVSLLQSLISAKEDNPDLKIYAYSVIMRLTTTVTKSEDLSVWEDIFEYSQLAHRVEFEPELNDLYETVKNRIPEDALLEYLNARKRNHEVNKIVIDLVSNNIIDYAVLVQEDTSEFGLHLKEQNTLREIIQSNNLNNKIIIKNGTDEMIALLLARYINEQAKYIELDNSFLDDDFIALYEDKPVIDNLRKSMEIANIVDEKSDYSIFILPTNGERSDLCFEEYKESSIDFESIDNHLKTYNDKKIGILDIKDANGGDPSLLLNTVKALRNNEFIAYSAWNTASNAIGSFLLDMTIAFEDRLSKDYLRLRILDDALYQGRVRKLVNDWMRNNSIDSWAMNSDERIDNLVSKLMNEEIQKYELIKDKSLIKAKLPWGRSFEIEMEKDYEKI